LAGRKLHNTASAYSVATCKINLTRETYSSI